MTLVGSGRLSDPVGAELLLQTVLIAEREKVPDGQLVEAITIPWLAICRELERDPNFLYGITPRGLEELIAAAYDRAGFDEVILTPHSGDHGRDVIATRRGSFSLRILDQAKKYKQGALVAASDVRELMGVLSSDRGASKGYVTTTSDFAPGITTDPLIAPLLPGRVQLRNGRELRDWLLEVRDSGKKS